MSMSLAVNDSWLNGSDMPMQGLTTTSGGGFLGESCSSTIQFYNYPYYTYPVYISSDSRPIKLTLSEVERLRKAARADKALKAVLSKFTSQIEITVDFE